MRRLLTLTVVLVAFASSRADEKINAPVPKTQPLPSIDGKYTLVATSGNTAVASGGFGGRGGGDTPLRVTTSSRSETIITKNEITIEPRTATGSPTVMEYTLDTTKSPITIDAEIINVQGKKTKRLGIVEMNGNRLTIALSKEGLERPKTTDDADGVTVYFFQKVLPPKVEFRIVAMTVGSEVAVEKELNKLVSEGFELVNTTNPLASDPKGAPTTVHFILKRTTKQQP